MMDPYQVLGIPRNASDEDIKKAYRDLVRKYHPDNYQDNPLADLAQEKMKEINEAYDLLMKNKGQGSAGYQYGGTSSGSSYGGQAYQNAGSPFIQVRNAINANNLTLAEQLLSSAQVRNAEWNFLMAVVSSRKGWMDEAYRYAQNAVNMEPGNSEYVSFYNQLNQSGNQYNPVAYNQSGNDCDSCDICSALCLANMCCNGGCR